MNQPAQPSQSLTCPVTPHRYVNAANTNVAATLARFGFVLPSTIKATKGQP